MYLHAFHLQLCCYGPSGSEPWEAASVLTASMHSSAPHRPETRGHSSGQLSGMEALKACRLQEHMVWRKDKQRSGCKVQPLSGQICWSTVLERAAHHLTWWDSCPSSAVRSYITHNSFYSPVCAAASLFKCFYELIHCFNQDPHQAPASHFSAEERSWEENSRAVLLFFLDVFHSPSAEFSPHSE